MNISKKTLIIISVAFIAAFFLEIIILASPSMERFSQKTKNTNKIASSIAGLFDFFDSGSSFMPDMNSMDSGSGYDYNNYFGEDNGYGNSQDQNSDQNSSNSDNGLFGGFFQGIISSIPSLLTSIPNLFGGSLGGDNSVLNTISNITSGGLPNIGLGGIGAIVTPKGYIVQFQGASVLEKRQEFSQTITDTYQVNQKAAEYYQTLQTNNQNYGNTILEKLEELRSTDLEKLPITAQFYNVFNGVVLDISDDEASQIKSISGVSGVFKNLGVHSLLKESVPQINANQLWQQGITGRGMKVAVIDTGVDYTHPDLGGCFGSFCKVAGGYDFVNQDNDPMDDNGHGTHCAGIVGASGTYSKGVAPDATIYAYKVLGFDGGGDFANVLAAVERAVKDGVDVISLSLGQNCQGYNQECGPDDPISKALDNAVASGVIVAVAAGNSGPMPSTIGSPGTSRNAITVGAVDKSDRLTDFSSRGPVVWSGGYLNKPDVVAPGKDICAPQYGIISTGGSQCGERLVAHDGTSMATPHVAGAAALLKQKNPNWGPVAIKEAFKNTAKNLPYGQNEVGSGRIDVMAASNYNPGIGGIIGGGGGGSAGLWDFFGSVANTAINYLANQNNNNNNNDQYNSAPQAYITCLSSNCETAQGTGINLKNDSTDSNGASDIANSKWYIKRKAESSSAYQLKNECSGKCDYTFSGAADNYTAKLIVTDYAGLQSSAEKDFVVKTGSSDSGSVSGTFSPSSAVLNLKFQIKCDYGIAGLPCITATHGGKDCVYTKFDGTAAVFECLASKTGTFENYCNLFVYSADPRCSTAKSDKIQSTNVSEKPLSNTYAPTSATLNSKFQMKCDYGLASLPCITATHAGNGCTYLRFDGTAAVFECAAAKSGTQDNYCNTYIYSADSRCSANRQDKIQSTNVSTSSSDSQNQSQNQNQQQTSDQDYLNNYFSSGNNNTASTSDQDSFSNYFGTSNNTVSTSDQDSFYNYFGTSNNTTNQNTTNTSDQSVSEETLLKQVGERLNTISSMLKDLLDSVKQLGR